MKYLEHRLTTLTLATLEMLRSWWAGIWPKLREERGDVPGWVMITFMTRP